ncbi:MAG TPA: hypothetical protein VMR41_02480 [Patescibacteria group bacterium]|nr:hypothetical protein [Patescibacteria group bacterium]
MIEALGIIALLLTLCSIVCLIVGLIAPSAFTGLFKRNLGRKKTSLVFSGITFALFVIFIILAVNSPTSSSSSVATQKNSVVATSKTVITVKPSPKVMPKPSTIAGLNITRDTVMNRLVNADPSINFQPSSSVNGITRYMAEKGQNGIELYGNADNLVEVASTALLGTTTSDITGNTVALIYVLGVANAVDSNSTTWVTSTMKEISTDWSNGRDTVKQSTVIDGKKFDISAMKSDVLDSVSLSIYSSQESNPPTKSKPSTPKKTNKPKLDATVKATSQYLIVTNNEDAEWTSCDYSIDYDKNPDDFYELGIFSNYATIQPHQTLQIPWDQITKMDGTKFVYTGAGTLPDDLYFFCSVNNTDKDWSSY